MIVLISMLLVILSIWYVPFRLKKLLPLKRAWPLQLLTLIILGGYFLIFVKGLFASANYFSATAYNILGLVFMFQVYLFIYMLITHIPAIFLNTKLKRIIAISGICLSFFLVAYGFIHAQSFIITRQELKLHNLKKPVTIMHIPDLHLGAQRSEKYLQKVITAINKTKPDIVIYNGDLVDSNIALRPELFALFQTVTSEQYYTLGNHEYYMDTAKALKLIDANTITILRSKMVTTHGIQLIGLDYMSADSNANNPHRVNNLTIAEELPKISRTTKLPTVLIHHSPVGLKYAAAGNIDLMLSGHTHAGQLFPNTILIQFLFPMFEGKYTEGLTTLIVSAGAGTFGPWMRLGTTNELQLIKLVPDL